ncbi:MAG: hypothetical protein H5T78_15700 [Nocardia sp.]|nr:hypothetical protein [Nocardia sp.]
MTGRDKPGLPVGTSHRGVPGGGENTHSWRHGEIVAAFTPLEVTGAMAQAEMFEQIVQWWDDGLRAFRYAVGESLAQAWSSAGATAAGSAVDAYLAQASDLSVALGKLPDVVRAAAEAIVATKYAIPPLVVVEAGSSSGVGGVGAVPTTGPRPGSVSSSNEAVHGRISAAAHGAASNAEEDAQAQMRRRYVLPFGELIDRIPLLPMPVQPFGSVGDSGDRRILNDRTEWLPDRRTAVSAVDADPFAEVGRTGSATVGAGSPPAEAVDESESAKLGAHRTGDSRIGWGTVADGSGDGDHGPADAGTGLAEADGEPAVANGEPAEADREPTKFDTGWADPEGGGQNLDGDAATRSTALDGGDRDEATSPRADRTVTASAEPDHVVAGGLAQPGGATAGGFAQPTGSTPAPSGPLGITGAGGAGASVPSGAGISAPSGPGLSAPGGAGVSVPGGAGLSVPSGAGSSTSAGANSGAAVDPAGASAGRGSPARTYTGLSWPTAGTEGIGARVSGGDGPRYSPTSQYDAQRPGAGQSVPGATGSVIGADPPTGHTSTRSVDRYIHGVAVRQPPLEQAEEAVRGLPEYLITVKNAEELLGEPRPTIAGGVIGGDGLVTDELRSSVARG